MIHYRKDTDNIVTLTFDMKDREHNVLNHNIADAFLPVLEHLRKEKEKHQLKGVILTSAKNSFLAGGDLEYLLGEKSAEEVFEYNQKLRNLFRGLEHPGVPVVAAINGRAIGMGFELAMACHHRIVMSNRKIRKVRLGFPEINFGLMPGNGGVIRLMWLLGIEKALTVLTNGRTYRPKEALKAGIIDELAHDEKDMLVKAKSWIMATKEGRRPWDRERGRIPHGTAHSPRNAGLPIRLMADMYKKQQHLYPAYQAILNTLIEGSKVDFDTAQRIESRYYIQLLQSKEAQNMIKAFWSDVQIIKKGANRPKGYGRFRPKKVGIIGAGKMGSGIALCCIRNGMQVVLKDVSKPVAERGLMYVDEQLTNLVELYRVSPEHKQDLLKIITTTQDPKEFEDCDIVIEAVFENSNVKKKVMKEAEAHMDRYSVLATNTISIPITELAESSKRPDNYIGLHFFAPAETVPIVEIIAGKQTSEETLARAYDFVHAINKTPIVSKDEWGFYAMRVQNTYILEGITMLQEGIAPTVIENLGIQAGMPIGPLALADELSLPMVLKYENQAAAHYGSKYIQHPAVSVLEKMIDECKRTGVYKKKGFYDYFEDGHKQLWSDLAGLYPNHRKEISKQKKIDRLLFAQVLEAVWCLQERVIQSIPEANLGSIYGWGFPKFKGGVIQFVHDYGEDAFLKKCKSFEKEFGQRFQVPNRWDRYFR